MDKSKKHQNKRNHIVIEIPEDSSCEIIEKH